jgi:hypothetical protein
MCDLNPIEMIWNTWKQSVIHSNYGKQQDFIDLMIKKFDEIDNSGVWDRSVRHCVREVESKYCNLFNIFQIPNESEHNYFFNCNFNLDDN